MRFAVWILVAGAASACSFSGHAVPLDANVDARGSDAPVADGPVDAPVDAKIPIDAAPDAPPACVPVAEKCNGADDDCDGLIDEDFALGAACDGADGDACMEGTIVCSSDGLGTTCNDTTATNVETCNNNIDDDCDGLIDCQQGSSCCGDAACTDGAYCCTGSGLVDTIPNSCVTDFGADGAGDALQVYCCGGITRFCLSGESCPWRAGCGSTGGVAAGDTTCSRAGLSTDLMATVSCQPWRSQTSYSCSTTMHAYFP